MPLFVNTIFNIFIFHISKQCCLRHLLSMRGIRKSCLKRTHFAFSKKIALFRQNYSLKRVIFLSKFGTISDKRFLGEFHRCLENV